VSKATQHIYEPSDKGLPLIGVILFEGKVIFAKAFKDRKQAEKRLRHLRTGLELLDEKRTKAKPRAP
jgi:hypothetical protein